MRSARGFVYSLFFVALSVWAGTENTALVVIDMQPIFVTRGGNDQTPENIKKVREVLDAQVKAIQMAKETHTPIVMIEYKNDGDTNETLKAVLKGYDNAQFFTKSTDGMFDSDNPTAGQIDDYLHKKNVGTLVVTGANGGACVHDSISGALDKKYNVVALSTGIADFNYQDFIYPYRGFYDDMKNACKGCVFREVDKVDGLTDIIGKHNALAPTTRPSKKAVTTPQPITGRHGGQ